MIGDLKMKLAQEFILREIADEYVLIPTGHTTEVFNGLLTLSESAVFIYQHIEEAESFDDLLNMMIKEYDVDKRTAANDAYQFINQMLQTGMVVLSDPEKQW